MRSQDAKDQLKKLLANEEVKIVYDDPWFWKLSISRSTKPDCAPKPYQNSVHGRNSHGRKKTIEITEYPVKPIQEEVDMKNDPIAARANSTKRKILLKKGSLKVVTAGFRQFEEVKIVENVAPEVATGPSYSDVHKLEE
jgi:hypothetical protein